MKTQRNVYAALVLTPAALLAACSSTNDGRMTNQNSNTGWYARQPNPAYAANRANTPTNLKNENPSIDNSASQYNTGVQRPTDPATGTINNQNNGTVGQPNWTRQEQLAANRAGSDPSSNPSNSNAQTANAQQEAAAAHNSPNNNDLAKQQGAFSGRQMGTAPATAAASTTSTTTANAQSANAQQETAATRNSTNNTDVAKQQGAFSGRQTGTAQPTTTASTTSAETANAQPATAVVGTDRNIDAVAITNASPETRILSILHMKNQHEIEMATLARSKSTNASIDRYADAMLADHTDADRKVVSMASKANVTLLSAAQTKQFLHSEMGAKADGKSVQGYNSGISTNAVSANDPQGGMDSLESLRALSGAEFDRAFAQKMVDGHRKLIVIIENAQPRVQNADVRALLSELLPIVRKHEQMARDLPGYSEAAVVVESQSSEPAPK